MSAQEITVKKNLLNHMANVTEKDYMYFNIIWYGYCTICSIVRKLLQFPALVVFFTAFNIAESGYKRNLLIFSISTQWYSDCSENSEISCTGLEIFAISLRLLMIFLSIQVILPESINYSMYLRFAVNPAVSCKRNRSSLMNFLNIQGFPARRHLSNCEYH